jgi:AraC-like DNA-binding protein
LPINVEAWTLGYPDRDSPMTASIQGVLEAGMRFDVETHQAELISSEAGWLSCRYLPTDRGGARCAGGAVDLGNVSVTQEAWQQPVHVDGAIDDRLIGFVVRQDTPAQYRGWGRPYQPNQLGVVTAGLELVLGKGSCVFAATLPKRLLQHTAQELGLDLDQTRLRSGGLMGLRKSQVSALRDELAASLRVPDSSIAREEAESRILATACNALSLPSPARLSASQRLWLARRARDYIEDNLTRSLRLAHLARAVDSDIRRLQRAFRDVFGISPYRYLVSRRLRLAHRRLLRANSDSSTVTRIALECGFGHLGRFAVDYRSRFGESPSTTLATPDPAAS